mgnify:CR=1 FL=1
MSTTTIYRLGRDPGELAEFRNSWRGAMQVWSHIAKRYLELDMFPFSGPDQKRVWQAHLTHPLSPEERIVLLSTMDNAAVRGADVPAVAAAFDAYGAGHTDSSYREQGIALRELVACGEIRPDDWIAWQQTSVGEFWGHIAWNEEREDYDWYDPATGTKHFDFYAEATAEALTVS